MSAFRILSIPGIVVALLAACATPPEPAAPDRAAIDRHFETLKATPPQLAAFLRAMPKGGDLHSHLSGAIYAESYIAWAIEDGLCLIVKVQTITAPPCDPDAGKPPIGDAVADPVAYNALIDALSVRNYALREASGHDQFFATFARFDAAGEGRSADMLAEVIDRAAAQNIHYLELMLSPGMHAARQIGAATAWDDDPATMLARLRAAGLDEVARRAAAAFARSDAASRRLLGCNGASRPPACDVTVRYIAQIIRVFPKEQVFAQIALGFLVAQQSPLVVGLNLVAPEDDRVSLADYSAHMRMIGALRGGFPGVGITLHAGELTLGLVPPKQLRFHIAEAVRVAGASRIGHGIDIAYEDDFESLLREMADRRILVEINLTSNAVILGVEGAQHPFETYRRAGVPLALSTDDEGVSRIDLTHEYQRAVETFDLDYTTIRALSRNSLTYAFIDGDSLWRDPDRALPVTACADDRLGAAAPSPPCRDFLDTNTKARLQWALEADFRDFEAAIRAAAT